MRDSSGTFGTGPQSSEFAVAYIGRLQSRAGYLRLIIVIL